MIVGKCSSELSSHKLQAKLKKSQAPTGATCSGSPWKRSGGTCSSPPQHPTQMEAPPYPLSSRAKPRDLQFSPPATNAAVLKMNCHPDRSEAEWRDLLFLSVNIQPGWERT